MGRSARKPTLSSSQVEHLQSWVDDVSLCVRYFDKNAKKITLKQSVINVQYGEESYLPTIKDKNYEWFFESDEDPDVKGAFTDTGGLRRKTSGEEFSIKKLNDDIDLNEVL